MKVLLININYKDGSGNATKRLFKNLKIKFLILSSIDDMWVLYIKSHFEEHIGRYVISYYNA